jgi:hypothetical protein
LVGAVGAAELLDCLVGAPRQFDGHVHAAALVVESRAGVEGDAGGGRVADDRDQLLTCN